MTAQQKQAVKTAGDRLQAIEAWTMATYRATVVGASALVLIALVMLYGAWEYYRIRTGISEAQKSMVQNLDKMQTSLKFPPPLRESR